MQRCQTYTFYKLKCVGLTPITPPEDLNFKTIFKSSSPDPTAFCSIPPL